MSASNAHVPVLLGPVACIGCAPSPPPEQPAHAYVLTDVSRNQIATWSSSRFVFFGKNTSYPSLARLADRALGGACRGEARVTKLSTRAFGVGAVGYWMYDVEIDIEAVPSTWPLAYCRPPPPPPPAEAR